MGGEISVTSEYGRGSSFTVTLPQTVVEGGPSPEPPSRDRTSKSLLNAGARATTVLVIDDDPAVHDLMRRSLEKEGYRTESAMDGKAGLELARRLQPAVITLDVMMPRQDGWSVLSALKADPATAARLVAAGHPRVAIHIGLSSGPVAAGYVGTERYVQYAVIGDTTNVASRVCSAAGAGEILITESTLALLDRERFRLEPLPPVAVKGKAEPLVLHRVVPPQESAA
jgi:CheY-like chemotaxis protein